jgi:hypothetical protein
MGLRSEFGAHGKGQNRHLGRRETDVALRDQQQARASAIVRD